MKIMKKMLVLTMALCMVLGCATTASAATSPKGGSTTPTAKVNKITVKKSKIAPTFKKSKLKKKAASYKINAKAVSKTKVTYKKVKGCKYIKVSPSGKVTIKKNIAKYCKGSNKKGVHKVKVKITAAAGNGYNKVTKTITLKIKIK